MKYLVKNTYLSFLFQLIVWTSLLFSCSEKYITKPSASNKDSSVVSKINQKVKDRILVCAHRGFHKKAPENSIESIKEAIKAKIDIVEIDINTTKDGRMVLIHDKFIDNLTNGKGDVSSYTLVELGRFFLKIKDSVTTHKIPTLEEVLEISKGKIILNLDIKNVNIRKLHHLLKKHEMQHQVMAYISDKNQVKTILSIDPEFAIMPLVSNRSEIEYYEKNYKSRLQHFNDLSFSVENIQWAQENGILVFMNSLWKIDKAYINDDTQEMDDIIARKPAIIQTDHPKKLLEYLNNFNF